MSQDLNIKITVRNGRLLRAVRDKFGTTAEMCRAVGIGEQGASALMTMRNSPFRKDGSLSATAEAIVSALGMEPDQLWPAHVARLRAKKASVEIEMSTEQFSAIAADNQEQTAIYRQAISKWSQTLTECEIKALTAHVCGATFDDIGREITCTTRERSRQIVNKAMRKIRKSALRDGVRSFGDCT